MFSRCYPSQVQTHTIKGLSFFPVISSLHLALIQFLSFQKHPAYQMGWWDVYKEYHNAAHLFEVRAHTTKVLSFTQSNVLISCSHS